MMSDLVKTEVIQLVGNQLPARISDGDNTALVISAARWIGGRPKDARSQPLPIDGRHVELGDVQAGAVLQVETIYQVAGSSCPWRFIWEVIDRDDDTMTVAVHPSVARAIWAVQEKLPPALREPRRIPPITPTKRKRPVKMSERIRRAARQSVDTR